MSSPNGDSIVQKIHTKSADDSFADVAGDLGTAHAHRPGLFQKDLEKVNTEMHARGFLPGLDVVGVNGQDLVTKRSADGRTILVDSAHLSTQHDAKTGALCTTLKSGGSVDLNPDGSGTYTVKKNDNDWTISRDVLKYQGIDNPSNTQIANYSMEMAKYNSGRNIAIIHEGDKLKLPPMSRAGDQTTFGSERADGKSQKAKDDAQKMYDITSAAASKYSGADTPLLQRTVPPSLSKDDITKALSGGLLPDDRKALTFMRDNFDSLANKDSGFLGAFKTGVIFQSDLSKWKDQKFKDAETQRLIDRGSYF